MRPLSNALPKALLPAGDKPLIEWILEKLAAAGFNEIIINHAHLGNLIESALGDGARFGVHLAYSPENLRLGAAHKLRHAFHVFPQCRQIGIEIERISFLFDETCQIARGDRKMH